MPHGRGAADLNKKHRGDLGQSRLQVCLSASRYKSILREILKGIGQLVWMLVPSRRRDRSRYLFPFCDAVFKTGKQLGYIARTLQDDVSAGRG